MVRLESPDLSAPNAPGISPDLMTRKWNILVTGSSGLIGSEAVEYFDRQGHKVVGVDNNMRPSSSARRETPSGTRAAQERHAAVHPPRARYPRPRRRHDAVPRESLRPDRPLRRAAVARPGGGYALLDFDVNAVGTVNLLEATRQHSPEAVFIFMSTNKVYGDAPNEMPARRDSRPAGITPTPPTADGIDETCRIDRSLHSLFGASKVAADVMAQEYGRYFGLQGRRFPRRLPDRAPVTAASSCTAFCPICVKVAITGSTYTVFGYKGKQVRDNIHSHDVLRAFEEFCAAIRGPARSTTSAAAARTASRSSRPSTWSQELSGSRINWSTRGRGAQRRSHLLHLRPSKISKPFSHLAYLTESEFDSGRNGGSPKAI